MPSARMWGTAGVLVAVLATAAPAHATDRFAVATGGATSGSCPSGTPCELQYALGGGSGSGDTIVLAAGTYSDPDGDGFELAKQLTVQGATGTRPVLQSTKAGQPALDMVAGVSDNSALRRLEFRAPAGVFAIDGYDNASAYQAFDVHHVNLEDLVVDTAGSCMRVGIDSAVNLRLKSSSLEQNTDCADLNGDLNVGGSLVLHVTVQAPENGSVRGVVLTGTVNSEDVTVTTGGVGGQILNGTHRRWRVSGGVFGVTLQRFAFGQPPDDQPPTALTDSIIRATGDAVYVLAGKPTLRNVTAVGAQRGIVADGADNLFDGALPVVVNSIARGATPQQDVASEPNECQHPDPIAPQCTDAAGHMSLSYSNVRTAPTAEITMGDGMQSANPFCALGTDLHLGADSPARNAGTLTGLDYGYDADGEDRVQDGAIDIGGDEAPATATCPQPPAEEPTPNPGTTTTPAGTTPAPTPTPTPTPAPDRVAPVMSGLKLAPRSVRRRAASTKLTFKLSEPAAVTVTVTRTVPGRRSGKRCLATSKRVPSAKRCRATQTAKRLRHTGAAGANTVSLRLPRTVAAAKYTVTLTATDAVGNAAKAVKATLTVRR